MLRCSFCGLCTPHFKWETLRGPPSTEHLASGPRIRILIQNLSSCTVCEFILLSFPFALDSAFNRAGLVVPGGHTKTRERIGSRNPTWAAFRLLSRSTPATGWSGLRGGFPGWVEACGIGGMFVDVRAHCEVLPVTRTYKKALYSTVVVYDEPPKPALEQRDNCRPSSRESREAMQEWGGHGDPVHAHWRRWN